MTTNKEELLQAILTRLDRGDSPESKWPDKKGRYWPLCPFHTDCNPGSFYVNKYGCKCYSCGSKGNLSKLAAHLGIELLQCCSVAEGDKAPPPPLTLEEYAKAKNLSVNFLSELGLETIYLKKQPVVKIPYYDEARNETAARFRLTLKKTKNDNRFRWRSGSKPTLYGLWRLYDIRRAGYVLLVEGESDCHTLWYYDLPALGVPGATQWKKEWSKYLTGLTVYVWQEPDQAGEVFSQKVGESSFDVRIITPPAGRKDISECHLLNADIPALIEQLKTTARPWSEIEQERLNTEAEEAKRKAQKLLTMPDILAEAAKTFQALGLVGEEKIAKLLYLAVTSRLLDRPVNVVVKGPSSGGKSFTVETVLKTFPLSAYYALSSMSERALAYSQEPLKHRFLVLYEAAGLTSDFGTYLMRTLLSEGRIRYETVEKTGEGLVSRLIEREGPTGLIVTTTWTSLHPENETRMFSITVKDDTDQTRAVLGALADKANGKGPAIVDLTPWHALQTWLELAGCHQVTIPYAHTLVAKVNPKAVRLRRDFGAVLTLIAAHAILHQAQRRRNEDGRIIATLDDYRAVYDLIIDIVSEGVQATVSETTRETVTAVAAISPKPVSVKRLAEKLALDESTTSRRVRVAISGGYLVNHEEKKGKPAKLGIGEALPEEEPVLPHPDSLSKTLEDNYYAELAYSSEPINF